MSKKILIAGESWTSTTIHTKGFDSFVTSVYAEGIQWLREAFGQGGWELDFLPNHYAAEKFPTTVDELARYDVVMLSDIGTNTLLLAPQTFANSQSIPNRCEVIRDYVLGGGGLCMVGGYLTFTGIDAKGRWGTTVVRDVLPIDMLEVDDRVESPQGVTPSITQKDHPVFAGIPQSWPDFLGYNRLLPNTAKGQVLATIGNGDPFVAVGAFGKGRSAIFASDCSPHWAPPAFCNWEYYGPFWRNLAGWLANA